MDLMEMIPYARINKGYRYILTCIDVFSRQASARPTKSKTGEEISKVIKTLFKRIVPLQVQTDLGKEFYNKHVQELFRRHKVKHYSVHSQFKAALCERFNRTLREKLNRYFTKVGKKTWYIVLQDIIDTYNNTPHRGIFNLAPSDITKVNEMEVWRMKQGPATQIKVKHKLLSYVRVSRVKGPFLKNFDQNWSDEVFRIIAIDRTKAPAMYVIEDLKHDVIQGKFYTQELQSIGNKPPEIYRIEKIIRTRGKGKDKEYFVKWHGYDSSYNSWVKGINRVNL